jgi:hypothetical protein
VLVETKAGIGSAIPIGLQQPVQRSLMIKEVYESDILVKSAPVSERMRTAEI